MGFCYRLRQKLFRFRFRVNLWGNLGTFVSPLLCGWLAENFGWNITLGVTVIPVAILLFVKPDISLLNNIEE
jgi:ACS family glucarate transporter-like MFS transporter